MKKLSVVLATRNEEANIEACLKAVEGIADEIIIYDEYSVDKTREIAKKYKAKVFLESHHDNFHITKQKAIDKAQGEWILQLDADEVVTKELAEEIIQVINLPTDEILKRRPKDSKKWQLFKRHSRLMKIGSNSNEVVAFFIPRKNFFLGRPLIHGGVYPDPAIRLIKKGKAYLPAKSVHEIMKVNGRVAWLFNDMNHNDSPTLDRYFKRLNRYTSLQAEELSQNKVNKGVGGFIKFVIIKPAATFLKIFIRHKGFLDGMRGFMWASLSASHFPIAYFKYVTS